MKAFELKGDERFRLHGLRGSADMFHLSQVDKKQVVIAPDIKKATLLAERLSAFDPDKRLFLMPPLDGSPFSFTSTHAQTRRTRLMTLEALVDGGWDFLVTTPQVFLETFPDRDALIKPRLKLRAGQEYNLTKLARDLAMMGYMSVDLVAQPGDFARRGGILDIYSFADDSAFRLEFFDDELEDIRTIDPERQRTIGHVDSITILPMFEWVVNEERAETFAKRGGELWNKTEARGHFLELVAQIRDRGRFPGYLHWTSLFFSDVVHLPDFLPPDTVYFIDDEDSVQEHQEQFLSQMNLQMDAMGSQQLQAPPRVLFRMEDPRRIEPPNGGVVLIHNQLQMNRVDETFITQSVPQYRNDVTRFLEHWKDQAKRQAILIVCHNTSLLSRLETSLDEKGFLAERISLPVKDELKPGHFYLAAGHLDTGFAWPDRHLVVFSENDIFAKTKAKRRPAKSGKTFFQSEFRDLKIGDYVVHLDHGIGRFRGLVEMEAGGEVHEMMALEYRDNQKLYVHLNQLDLVQRYGSENAAVQLDRMGGVSWSKAKARVKKAVRQMAEELIKLYAERRMVKGLGYGPEPEWQAEFEDRFEHEPTEGQLSAVADIKRDLGKPMDRLLVGDVGFGKTEVAMRMAFRVVIEGFQVAVLCPTTVLAFQHYHTFKNRFEGFPVNIRWVSRFTSPAHTKKTIKDTSDGQVDILIGTHRILSKDLQFKNLGALIIDEEQRFGVSHKEKLKQLRKQVDVLSMSATPIPRTLNMSLTGIRDISVIESPPRNRLAISTMVAETREGLIRNAIDFELERGGQVYFIHNRVETMEAVATNLKRLAPNASIAMAHGQMDAKRIERVMLDFMERKVDILVASTIIENGVDIPNANTMIINRADKFGMSQLYQLRGRIGRSDRPAYAFLLVPAQARMTDLARKRLATLEEFSDLGAGFRIAAMDLELRGAGNMLGGEQAGHINTIGYEMYIKLLDEAVRELQGKPVKDHIHCQVNLGSGAALPKTYIEETNQRLSYYKKLAAAQTEETLVDIRETLEDCYGNLPTPAESLYQEHLLRIHLAQKRVLQAEMERGKVKLRFHEQAEVNPELILRWMQEREGVTVSPDGLITLPTPARNPPEVMDFIRDTVSALLA